MISTYNYRGHHMKVVMRDMSGAKVHIFETGSVTRVARTFRWNFAEISEIKNKAHEYIDNQLKENGEVCKLLKVK